MKRYARRARLVAMALASLTLASATSAQTFLEGTGKLLARQNSNPNRDQLKVSFRADAFAPNSPLCPAVSRIQVITAPAVVDEIPLDCALWTATGSGWRYNEKPAGPGSQRTITLRDGRFDLKVKGEPYARDAAFGPMTFVDVFLDIADQEYCGRFARPNATFPKNGASVVVARGRTGEGQECACAEQELASCDDLCDSGSGTISCFVRGCKRIAPGAVIDCGTRNLVVTGPGARLWTNNGSFTVRAKNLQVGDPDNDARPHLRRLEATRDPGATMPFGMRIELSGDLDLFGELAASSFGGGGEIDVAVAGAVRVHTDNPTPTPGRGMRAQGLGPGASGGQIRVAADAIDVRETIVADGSAIGASTGGRIELDAGAGDLFVGAELSTRGYGNASGVGQGGEVVLHSDDDLSIDSKIVAAGIDTDANGGAVEIGARRVLLVQNPQPGRKPHVSVAGSVQARATEGNGGTITLTTTDEPGAGVQSSSDVVFDLSGGLAAGTLVLDARNVQLGGGFVSIDAVARAAGAQGGSVTLRSASELDLASGDGSGNGTVDIDVVARFGAGGHVVLEGCDLDFGDRLLANVVSTAGGRIDVLARDTVTRLAGKFGADENVGVRFRSFPPAGGSCSEGGAVCAGDDQCPGGATCVPAFSTGVLVATNAPLAYTYEPTLSECEPPG